MVRPETFIARINESPYYYWPNVDWERIQSEVGENLTLSNSRKVKYYEVPMAFDIETTSHIVAEQKMAWMYHWQFSIQGFVIMGRTWAEWEELYNKIVELFQPDERTRIIIYIQNLSYEFQFMCKRFKWQSVFSLRERKPLKAVTEDYVEFRCSYMLSGYNLATIGKNLQRYKVEKMEGDLNYDLVRHSKSPVNYTEMKYCINDVQVIVAYIQETAENDGGYHKIPLTKTGYVREYCREECFAYKNYRQFMKLTTINFDEYKQLKRAFAGGFTHANWHRANRTWLNMDSYDFTSSYPSVMVAEKYPMSTGRLVDDPQTEEQIDSYISNYCCLFDIEIIDIDGWDAPDHILSEHKCQILEGWREKGKPYRPPTINNGRVICAHRIKTTITDVDYVQLKKFYNWEYFQVSNFRIYQRGYLPTPFVKAILTIYQDKTTLKDVEEKVVEYMKSKNNMNSCFGMAVTDIVRDESIFDEELPDDNKWTKEKANGPDAIDKYNNSKKRFLFYPWGVWVTAYARANLYSGILEFGDDYVYADTDSIKALNVSSHLDYIEKYNIEVTEKLRKACEYHGIDFNMTRPKTIKGIEKPLGIWDYDGHYDAFKTLGAKRYLVLKPDGNYALTVAGLAKKDGLKYILSESKKQNITPFDLFTDQLYIPKGHTGKNIHTYIDFELSATVTDYTGVTDVVHEYSAIYMEPADYSLSLAEAYLKLLFGIEEMEI